MKFDEIDQKILSYITDNARASISEIARKTGIPRDSVRYRLQRLEKNEIIFMYHTFVDHKKIGYPVFAYVNIELHNLSPGDEESLLAYLKEYKYVTHIAKLSGRWDLLLSVCAKDLEMYDDILRTIRQKFGRIIKDYTSSSIIKEYKYDNFSRLLVDDLNEQG